MNNEILQIVLDALRNIGEVEQLDTLLNADENTRLYGGNGVLDSVGVVMLIAEVEDLVGDKMGKTITLADERAMSQKTSPFRAVKNLVDYIDKLLCEQE